MVTAQLGAVLRHIRRLATDPTDSEQTDGALLRAFLGANDQTAFEALLRRHGPMVLRVCRRTLGNSHDAEDALQATFLVLARQARSIRKKESLGSWLHGVAYRMATHAKRGAARRHKHESRATPTAPPDPALTAAWKELQALLDEEIDRLPETLRAAFILCCLANQSHAEAARQLGVKEATVGMRLSRARKLLRERLNRRGVSLTAVLGAVALGTNAARAAVPASLVIPTAKAATFHAAGQAAAAGLVSTHVAALTEGMLKAMFTTKLKLTVIVLLVLGLIGTGTGTLAALRCLGGDSPPLAPQASQGATPDASKKETQQAASTAQDGAAKKTITISGRVLDPGGKPFKGAQVFVMASYGDPNERAKTDADGRFEFHLRPGEVVGTDKRSARSFYVVAAAAGYGPAWIDANDKTSAKDVILQLVKDGVIEGRILTQEGKPVAGATVGVLGISTNPDGRMVMGATSPLRGRAPLQPKSVTVDDEGRFRLAGAGRGRVVQLTVEGPGIASEFLQVMTTTASLAVRVAGGEAQSYQFGNTGPQIYGAKFEHRAQPGRTITGVVREAGTGKPLAGIAVGNGVTSTRTDKDGRYEVRGWAKAKEYYVVVGVGDRDHCMMITAVADTAGLGPLTAPDTELTRGIPFRGKIIDKVTGKPVAGGEVWYFALWPNADAIKLSQSIRYGAFSAAIVAEDGTFTFSVLPGPGAVTLRGHGDDYVAARVDPPAFFKDKLGDAARSTGDREHLKIVGATDYTPSPQFQAQDQFQAIVLIHPDQDAKEIKHEIALEPVHKLKVTVRGVDGKPLAGIKVHGRKQEGEYEDWAGSEFTMTRPDPKRPRTLLVVHEATRQIGTLALKGDETGPLEVRLRPWATVTGRLVNADGEPCAGTYVNPMAGDRHIAYPPQNQIKTDKDGTFRVAGMVPGVNYQLHYAHISAEGRIEAKDLGIIAEDLILKEGESRDLGSVTGHPRFRK
jgi:RNA polymerase sigma factor (sigma-70 family)